MPRKKVNKEYVEVKYFIPQSLIGLIDNIVEEEPLYKDKALWRRRYYYLIDYLDSSNTDREDAFKKVYTHLNIQDTAAILGIINKEMTNMVNKLKHHNLIEADMKVIPGKKSMGYALKIEEEERTMLIQMEEKKEAHIRKKRSLQQKLKNISGDNLEELLKYKGELDKLRITEEVVDDVIEEILKNRETKKKNETEFREFLNRYRVINNQIVISKNCHSFQSFSFNNGLSFISGKIVPIRVTVEKVVFPLDGKLVPASEKRCFPFDGKFVPEGNKSKKVKMEEPYWQTVNRIKRLVYRMNDCRIVPSRKDKGRVFTDFTRMNREFRKHVTIEGNHLIGLDVANCQPLLAAILLKGWFQKHEGKVPEEVYQYQRDCESGLFYNNFMNQLQLPDHLRTNFKTEMFKEIFFGMNDSKKKSPLIQMFKDRYPNCARALYKWKGDKDYAWDYDNKVHIHNVVAITLQDIETDIMFNANLKLIEMGVSAVNLFDAIYVGSYKDYQIAETVVREAFHFYGINPIIKPDYVAKSEAQIQDEAASIIETAFKDVEDDNEDEIATDDIEEFIKKLKI